MTSARESEVGSIAPDGRAQPSAVADPVRLRGADPERRRPPELRGLMIVAALATLLCGGIALSQRNSNAGTTVRANVEHGVVRPLSDASVASTALPADAPAATSVAAQDLTGADPEAASASASCTMAQRSAHQGDSGPDVSCIQRALIGLGLLPAPASGTFDQATTSAVRSLQTTKDMFVDGVVGRESALSLGVWPDETSLVVHTAPPATGAKDLLGYPLSSVAVNGSDAPPLPSNSGNGKRLVYSRAGQRLWAVDKTNTVIRSWLVSGSKYNNEEPGTHTVFSRSATTTAWNGKAILPLMVRYQATKLGAIGFHGIPIHVADGTAYMTEDQLGTRLSGGCQRQATLDADFVWAFAQIGTTVVVL